MKCFAKCRYGKAMFFLGWHEIRQTLYEALPSGVVEFGRKFDSYTDEGEDGIVLHFMVRRRCGVMKLQGSMQVWGCETTG